MSKQQRPVVVIGYGSIGRRHARALAALTPQLAIVNRRPEVRAAAQAAHPEALVVGGLEELDEQGFAWAEAAAVIATWGPSHAALFEALAERGVRRILCEKPMAASVADAWHMARRADGELVLGLNHTLRYAGLKGGLDALAGEHELGPPVGLLVTGGAACLLTNGIHWLDFACELFDGAPQTVTSTAYDEAINPRAPELGIFGGTAVWGFGERRECVISFSNRASLAAAASVVYRDALVGLRYVSAEADSVVEATLRQRDMAMVERYPAITRTGPPAATPFQGLLPGVLSFDEGMAAAAAELLHADRMRCSAAQGATAVAACIGALIASRERRTIDLPIDPQSAWGQEHWPIS